MFQLCGGPTGVYVCKRGKGELHAYITDRVHEPNPGSM